MANHPSLVAQGFREFPRGLLHMEGHYPGRQALNPQYRWATRAGPDGHQRWHKFWRRSVMFDLDETIRQRHSTRMFLPDPVPRHLVDESLALAMCAPSNSNVQPSHVVFTTGAARKRLVGAMLAGAGAKPPNVPALPESHAYLRRELGAVVYGGMGIARDDVEGRKKAV